MLIGQMPHKSLTPAIFYRLQRQRFARWTEADAPGPFSPTHSRENPRRRAKCKIYVSVSAHLWRSERRFEIEEVTDSRRCLMHGLGAKGSAVPPRLTHSVSIRR